MKERVANILAFIALLTTHMAIWRALRYNGVDVYISYFIGLAIVYPLMRFIFKHEYKEENKDNG